MPKFTLEKYNSMYEKGKLCDEKLFSEMRTNILLKAGEHYNKSMRKQLDNLRNRGVPVNNEAKIRLTKNHIHRINNAFSNHILESDPSVGIEPFNKTEIQDVKTAQQNDSVLQWIKETNKWNERRPKLVDDFIDIGEVGVKVYYDYGKGPRVLNPETGEEENIGEIVIERLFAFDLKRNPEARSLDEVEWWIHERMVDVDKFKKLVKDFDPEKADKISKSSTGTLKVFDANTGEYKETKGQVHVKEFYMYPNEEYPNGWYAMFTSHVLVTEGELPFGIYPLEITGFDELTTSPRHASIVRVCRPYQVEINRSASKMAEHQITIGDDKVFIQKGTKLSASGKFSGVAAYSYSGQPPIVSEGRTGIQYLDYQLSQIKEMYEACDLAFLYEEKAPPVQDPYLLLFTSMKHKKRFMKYIGKWESFEIRVFKKALEVAKNYLSPAHFIKVAGTGEIVNIAEFQNSDHNSFRFKVVPQNGDIETKFGKALTTVQVLQYAGSGMSQDQIGQLIRELPFGSFENTFSTMTQKIDNAQNDILALDRGEQPPFSPIDDHEFMINALTHRMKKSDFRYLDPVVQQNYLLRRQMHEQALREQQQLASMNELGMIPSGGFLVTVNASWFNPSNNRVERIKVPSDAVMWLVKKLNEQGVYAQQMQNLPLDVQAEMGASNQIAEAPMIQGLNGPQAQNINVPQAQQLGV